MLDTLELNLHRSQQIFSMNIREVNQYKLKTEDIGN